MTSLRVVVSANPAETFAGVTAPRRVTVLSSTVTGPQGIPGGGGGFVTDFGAWPGVLGGIGLSQSAGGFWHGSTFHFPFAIAAAVTITEKWVEVMTLASGHTLYVAIYEDGGGGQPGVLAHSFASVDTTTTGVKKETGLTVTLAAGKYVLAWSNTSSTAQYRCVSALQTTATGLNSALGSNLFLQKLERSGTPPSGVWADPGSAWATGNGGSVPGIYCPIYFVWSE